MLSDTEIERFRADGFLILPAIAGTREMAEIRILLAQVLSTDGHAVQPTLHRHIDARPVYDLCCRAALLDWVSSLLGPDLLLWHTRFFDKPADEPPVPWHQDMNFWPIEPDICVSVWIAIDRADRENACLEIIPGSHRNPLVHVETDQGGRFANAVEPSQFDENDRLFVELDPGEVLLFDRWLVHGSGRNTSGRGRLALAARYVPPEVRVDFDAVALTFPELGALIVRGEDTCRRNRLGRPPGSNAA